MDSANRLAVELSALAFQGVLTLLLLLVYYGLWRQRRRPYDLTWAAAWGVYALGADCREDLGVLRLMRRAAPDVPLVLLAAEDSLDTRRCTQPFRPIYFAIGPVEGAELRDVVRAAIRRRGRAM
jgi:hypothetical protein